LFDEHELDESFTMRLQLAALFGLLLLRVVAGWADSPATGALVAGMSRPAPAKIEPVVEELWGQTVTDD
jgi:hypothetical protein